MNSIEESEKEEAWNHDVTVWCRGLLGRLSPDLGKEIRRKWCADKLRAFIRAYYAGAILLRNFPCGYIKSRIGDA
jgi:hypothetical protein